MRTVTGPTDHVVVVGAGLGGLSAALRLAGAGRQVTVLEREPVPGGRAGLLDATGGYRFDTGPTVLTMPDLIADALDCVGEELTDWLDPATRSTPLYRAFYADGSTPRRARRRRRDGRRDRRASAARRRPPATAATSTFVSQLYRYEMRDFIDRNIDSPLDLLTPEPRAARRARRLPPAGAQGRVSTCTTRGRSGSSPSSRCTPGSRRTTRSRSTPSSPTWTRWPGCSSRAAACTRCRARSPAPRRSTACEHPVRRRRSTRVELRGDPGRRRAHRRTASASPCDVVVLNPDLPVAYRDLLGREPRSVAAADATRRRASCCSPGRRRRTPDAAHHTIHFGRAWRRGVRRAPRRPADERPVVPGHQPDAVATRRSRPAGGQSYYVLFPTPEPRRADRLARLRHRATATRSSRPSSRAATSGFGDAHRGRARDDAAGLGRRAAWSAARRSPPRTRSGQTGPFRPRNLWGENVVFAGSGTAPGRRACRWC